MIAIGGIGGGGLALGLLSDLARDVDVGGQIVRVFGMGDLPGTPLAETLRCEYFAGVQCLQKFRGRLFAQAAVFYVSVKGRA